MIVNIAHALKILHVPEIATRVNNHPDRLEPLSTAQAAGNAGREPVCAHIAGPHCDRLGEIEPANLPKPLRKVECLRQHDRVKRHRKPRLCPHDPIKTTKDIAAAAAQCPVFELEIYSVVVPDLSADGLNVSITESSDAAMSAAQ